MQNLRRPRGIFYGWYLVGISSFMLMLMSTTVFQGVGTFFVEIAFRFRWIAEDFVLRQAQDERALLFRPPEWKRYSWGRAIASCDN